jgi:hypothetical protein
VDDEEKSINLREADLGKKSSIHAIKSPLKSMKQGGIFKMTTWDEMNKLIKDIANLILTIASESYC